MSRALALRSDERLLFQSARSGSAGRSHWFWGFVIVYGLWTSCGIQLFLSGALANEPWTTQLLFGFPIALLAVAIVRVGWQMLLPSFFVTTRRIVARRLFLPAIEIDPADVTGAARVVVSLVRVVDRFQTHQVVVLLRSESARRFGPVKDAEDMVRLLDGLSLGVIDLKALPDLAGSLSAAERRADVFFAQGVATGGQPRGPLFVGPAKVIAFATRPMKTLMDQMYTIAAAPRTPAEIEESMLTLAGNTAFGRAVVMSREGATLTASGGCLTLASEVERVVFEFGPDAVKRAEKQFPKDAHPYR